MKDTRASREAEAEALATARQLVDMGIPVFAGRLDRDGNPDRRDPRWAGWQNTYVDPKLVGRWRPGDALAAVCGVKCDVIDIDPRNGGDLSAKRLMKDLGDDGPEIFWKVKTPSSGIHLYVAPLGIGTHHGFLPGIDLQGGRPEGEGRGFVFLPPTVRPSKANGRRTPYRATAHLTAIGHRCSTLSAYITEREMERGRAEGSGSGGSRRPVTALELECLNAGEGEQRPALLRYVHEMERLGYTEGHIISVLKDLVAEMPVFDERRPWFPARGTGGPERELRGLLHRAGTVIPDATAEEMAGEFRPITAGLVRSVADLDESLVTWGWEGVIAIRELTLLDGEKGQGKTFVVDDVAARWSRGLPMPEEDRALMGPANVIIFTDEGHAESVLKPRLRAAGADMRRIFIPALPRRKRGREEDWELGLPGGAGLMARMIAEASATLAIWDPVTDFLSEDIQSHNDASVRRALRPLGRKLGEVGAAGLAIRHMNKDTSASAKHRGSGSSAFQNRARVHLVSGELPTSMRLAGDGAFGIAMVDTNMRRRREEVLAYEIVDSEIVMDDLGSMVGRVEWKGYVSLDADTLVAGEAKKRGPRPSAEREDARMILEDMFGARQEWPAQEAWDELKANGVDLNKETVYKILDDIGARRERRHSREGRGGIANWVWTVAKIRADEGERRPTRGRG